MGRKIPLAQRQVTNVVGQQESVGTPNIWGDVAGQAVDLTKKAMYMNAEAGLVDAVSNAQMKINELSRDFKTGNQGTPNDNKQTFDEQRQKILDGVGENISGLVKRDWWKQSDRLKTNSDVDIGQWAFKQTQTNTVSSINNSIQTGLNTAAYDGEAIATGEKDLNTVLDSYQQNKDNLLRLGSSTLGETATNDMLKTYDSDVMKSILSGVIQQDPRQALSLLEREEFNKNIDAKDIDFLKKTALKQIKTQSLESFFVQEKNESNMLDVLSSDDSNYNKRLAIDRANLDGAVSNDFAVKFRRVLTSEKAVDATTDNIVMSDIIMQAYDLNATADMNSEEYLKGVGNIKTNIMGLQAKGELSQEDVNKLNNQIKTLTNKKVSEATVSVAYNFKGASKIFDTLPPELKGEAIRDLFYQTHDKDNLSKNNYINMANNITDKINKKRRIKTIEQVNSVLSDNGSNVDFLKTLGVTMEEVRKTAKNRGLTEQQVINKLKAMR